MWWCLQRSDLRNGVEIVVATPGRLIDHLQQGNTALGKISFIVLDEVRPLKSFWLLRFPYDTLWHKRCVMFMLYICNICSTHVCSGFVWALHARAHPYLSLYTHPAANMDAKIRFDITLGYLFLLLLQADRMLDMGFEPQIREVMQSLRKEHQTLLFSATMPEEIESLVDDYLRNAVRVKVGNIRPTANVSQHLEKTTDVLKVGPNSLPNP